MNEIFKDISYIFILIIAVYVAFHLGTRHDTLQEKTDRHDCNLTEFIAQVPDDVREECRRRRIEIYNQTKGN